MIRYAQNGAGAGSEELEHVLDHVEVGRAGEDPAHV